MKKPNSRTGPPRGGAALGQESSSGRSAPGRESAGLSNHARWQSGLDLHQHGPGFERFIGLYCSLGIVIYSILLVKGLLVCLVNSDLANHYKWLDCYLVGRYTLAPRVPETSRYCALILMVYHITSRLIIRGHLAQRDWSCFRFLSMNWGQVSSSKCAPELALHEALVLPASEECLLEGDRSRFVENSLCGNELLLKPNRTPGTWKLYKKYLNFLQIYSITSLSFGAIASLRASSPLWVTKIGFTTVYKRCVTWMILDNYDLIQLVDGEGLLRMNASRYSTKLPPPLLSSPMPPPVALKWEHILPFELISSKLVKETLAAASRAPAGHQLTALMSGNLISTTEEMPILLPYESFLPTNLYQSLKMASDTFECSLIMLDTASCFIGYLYICIVFSLDLVIYSRQLIRALVKLEAGLRAQQLAACDRADRADGGPQRVGRTRLRGRDMARRVAANKRPSTADPEMLTPRVEFEEATHAWRRDSTNNRWFRRHSSKWNHAGAQDEQMGTWRAAQSYLASDLPSDNEERDKLDSTNGREEYGLDWCACAHRFCIIHSNTARGGCPNGHDEQLAERQTNELCTIEVSRTQALIHDYFMVVGEYNQFVGQITFLHIFLWICYMLMFCLRFVIPDKLEQLASFDTGAEFEFYALFLTSGFYVVTLVGAESLVKSSSHKLYQLISTAMALDRNTLATKLRWRIILNYYHPRILHCFSIFGSGELSFLFILKLLSWMVSAIFIIRSLAL